MLELQLAEHRCACSGAHLSAGDRTGDRRRSHSRSQEIAQEIAQEMSLQVEGESCVRFETVRISRRVTDARVTPATA